MIEKLEFPRPIDFHVHLRDNEVLQSVASYTALQFGRALIMPNLVPPVTTVTDAMQYRSRILAALPPDAKFEPLMTLYLTDNTTVADIRDAADCPHLLACKLYPAGATTNSAFGVTSLENIRSVLLEMERVGLVLCVHGEVTDPGIDIFEREELFITNILPMLLSSYPRLRIVLEHATTAVAVSAVENAAENGALLAATLTPHHLLHSRNALFDGARIHPDMFCLPILKREHDRKELLRGATGKYSYRFFAGTDSAPHTREKKLCADGCAGIFNAPAAVQLYAEAFDEVGAIDKLPAFLSQNGAAFYGIAISHKKSALYRKQSQVIRSVNVSYASGAKESEIQPLAAGKTIEWSYSCHLKE